MSNPPSLFGFFFIIISGMKFRNKIETFHWIHLYDRIDQDLYIVNTGKELDEKNGDQLDTPTDGDYENEKRFLEMTTSALVLK